MAASFLSTANTFLCSSSSSAPTSHKLHFKTKFTVSKALSEQPTNNTLVSSTVSKRSLAVSFIATSFLSIANASANAAVLEADDDVELLEKVKKDRKKRLDRQGVINSSNKEKGYLQDLVYKLSEIGQAIDRNDLPAAGSVLGGSTETEWLKNANLAFTKLTTSPEEKTEVDTFNSSLASLISSVTKNDIESSKVAFVSSASAFERWTTLTGLGDVLRGL